MYGVPCHAKRVIDFSSAKVDAYVSTLWSRFECKERNERLESCVSGPPYKRHNISLRSMLTWPCQKGNLDQLRYALCVEENSHCDLPPIPGYDGISGPTREKPTQRFVRGKLRLKKSPWIIRKTHSVGIGTIIQI